MSNIGRAVLGNEGGERKSPRIPRSTKSHALYYSSTCLACVAGGIVRVRRKSLTVESEYGRRGREENEKEPL